MGDIHHLAKCDTRITEYCHRAWHLAELVNHEHKEIPMELTYQVLLAKLIEECVPRRDVEYPEVI